MLPQNAQDQMERPNTVISDIRWESWISLAHSMSKATFFPSSFPCLDAGLSFIWLTSMLCQAALLQVLNGYFHSH